MDFKDCKIIRKKVKNARISIKSNWEVIIGVPRFCLPGYPKKLFESKKDWIEEKLSHINKTKTKLEWRKWEIKYHWEFYKLVQNDKLKQDYFDYENREIFCKNDLSTWEKLEIWYKKDAKKYLIQRTEDIAENEWFRIGKISVRNQSSRWWSCSGKNNISLNWRLIKCPKNIVDYVIYHELTHTIEKNHSDKFRSKLESYLSDCKESRKWLKINWGEMFL